MSSKAILEVIFDVEATEAVLNDLEALLTEGDSALIETLTSLVQEKLSEVEGVEDIDVTIPTERIVLRSPLEGGLNAQEWMDQEDVLGTGVKDQINEQGFQD